jgi:UV excision repair protein RAD23
MLYETRMQITVRLINGNKLLLEVDPSQTIRDLKELLSRDHQVSNGNTRLIYKGADLPDDSLISSLNIQPHEFIVLLQSKSDTVPRPPPPAAPVPPPSTTSEPTAETPPEQKPAEVPSAPSVQPLPTFEGPPSVPLLAGDDPPNLDELAASLSELGFSKADCEDALRYAKFDPDLAAEVLVSGRLDILRAAYLHMLVQSDQLFGTLGDISEEEMDEPAAMDPEVEDDEGDDGLQEFTPEERAKIKELVGLGFDRSTVVQVFLACDKDAEVTANCLLSEKR